MDAYQDYIARKRDLAETGPLQEWEEFSPHDPHSYRCQQCGRRWQDNEVYPDPARSAWTCRACHTTGWVYAPPGRHIWTNVEQRRYRRHLWMRFWLLALPLWPLLTLLLRAVAWSGNYEGSTREEWAGTIVIALGLSVILWIVTAVLTSQHADDVESQHGCGPSVTWQYPPPS